MNIRKSGRLLGMGALLALAIVSVPARHADAMQSGSGSGGGGTAVCTMFTGTGPNDLIIVREDGETYTDKDGNTYVCTHWGDWLMVPMTVAPPQGTNPVKVLPVRSTIGSIS